MGDSSVLLVDADPQGSARDGAAARESPPDFSVVGLDRPTLHRDLPAIAANCRIEIKTSGRKLKWVRFPAVKRQGLPDRWSTLRQAIARVNLRRGDSFQRLTKLRFVSSSVRNKEMGLIPISNK